MRFTSNYNEWSTFGKIQFDYDESGIWNRTQRKMRYSATYTGFRTVLRIVFDHFDREFPSRHFDALLASILISHRRSSPTLLSYSNFHHPTVDRICRIQHEMVNTYLINWNTSKHKT